MIVTRHARKRIRQRLGLNKSAVQSMADQAETHGHPSTDFTGRFRLYMDDFHKNLGPADKAIYHNGYIFLCESERLITVFPVPSEFRGVKPKTKAAQS